MFISKHRLWHSKVITVYKIMKQCWDTSGMIKYTYEDSNLHWECYKVRMSVM